MIRAEGGLIPSREATCPVFPWRLCGFIRSARLPAVGSCDRAES